MSKTQSEITEASELQTIHGIGPARSKKLGMKTVGELANSSAQQLFNTTEGMSAGEIEEVVDKAREAIGMQQKARVYTVDTSDESDSDDSVEITDESFGDDVDAFIGASGVSTLEPGDCETVAILAGDDAFDVGGEYGDLSPVEQAQLVQRRLMEFGFDNIETIYALDSGMGRQAVNSWASYTKNETDQALPELRQVAVKASGRYPTGDDYRERNARLLDRVDGICVVANGEYVGMWVNMVNNRDDVIIRTPMMNSDE